MTRKNFLDNREERLLEQATRCLAGNPRATLNEIADYAGIGIATLHRHFESREKLYIAISHKALDLVEAALLSVDLSRGTLRDLVLTLAERLIPLGDRAYFLMSEYYTIEDEVLDRREAAFWDRLKNELTMRQGRGELRPDLGIDWVVTVLYTLMFTLWTEIHQGNIAANQAARILADTLLQGVAVVNATNSAVFR